MLKAEQANANKVQNTIMKNTFIFPITLKIIRMMNAVVSTPLAKVNNFNHVANMAMDPITLIINKLAFRICAVSIISIIETTIERMYADKSIQFQISEKYFHPYL